VHLPQAEVAPRVERAAVRHGAGVGDQPAGLAVGVVGGLVILRPGIVTVGTGEILLLVSSIVWAVALMDIKVLARTETSVTTTVYGAVFLIPITFVAALLFWRAPEPAEILILLGVGALGSIGQVAVAQAFHEAEAAQVMPGDFTKLLFGSLIGFLFFAERPDIWTLVGGSLVFGSVVYIAYRDAQQHKAARPREPA
jgi:drug/metabolite transporter (DMT)-like permease